MACPGGRLARLGRTRTNGKQGLGLVRHAGKVMVWGKGAVAGDFVFLSGVEARSDAEDVPPRTMEEQVKLVLDRIDARLKDAGTTIDNAIRFVWYVADRSQLHKFYDTRDGWFAKHAPRLLEERSYASTLLIVGLARHDMLVEVDCTAYIPRSSGSSVRRD